MLGILIFILALGGFAATRPELASAQGLPQRTGQCVTTAIAEIGTRLEDPQHSRPNKDTGSSVRYANGGYQVSYDYVAALDRSRIGDAVLLCLKEIPTGCPPGDNRGRIYRGTNLRTNESWTLPDSAHSCGGA